MKRTAFKKHPPKGQASWMKRKAEWLAGHRTCEFGFLEGGDHWGPLDVHHITPRGSGGTSEDTSPLVTLCRKHHQDDEP